jgi:endonuclease YncB( thermonuclease family)
VREHGEGHVGKITDGCGFRLTNAREIRLAGTEPLARAKRTARRACFAILTGD